MVVTAAVDALGEPDVATVPGGEVLLVAGAGAGADAAPSPAPAQPVVAAMITSMDQARLLMGPSYPLTSGPCQ